MKDYINVEKMLDTIAGIYRDCRDWLVDWFFETVGIFGISYSFGEYISEVLYQHEKEAS